MSQSTHRNPQKAADLPETVYAWWNDDVGNDDPFLAAEDNLDQTADEGKHLVGEYKLVAVHEVQRVTTSRVITKQRGGKHEKTPNEQ